MRWLHASRRRVAVESGPEGTCHPPEGLTKCNLYREGSSEAIIPSTWNIHTEDYVELFHPIIDVSKYHNSPCLLTRRPGPEGRPICTRVLCSDF